MYLVKNSKSPFYQIVYYPNGKRSTLSTRTKNKEKAEAFLDNFKDGLFEPPKKQVQIITLSKFRDEYINFIQVSKSKHYVKSSKLSFRMLMRFTGDIPLNRLDLKTLDKFINTTFSRAQKAAGLYYRTLKAAFSKAVVWEYISENPLKKIKAPKVAKQLPFYISETELNLIIANTKERYLKDLFLTAFYTGMRQAEIVNMKWDWIDLKENIITVKNSISFTTKSKKERIIPICSTLKNTLTNHYYAAQNKSIEDFVFTHVPGIKLNEDYVCKKFKKVIRILGLNDKIHFHTLRHSFASMLVQKGVKLYVVKELLGHESLVTTQIYSHLQKGNLIDAVNLI